MATRDGVDIAFRENNRYSGDGLPGEPSGAPLPIGDPQSGPYSPSKAAIRLHLGQVADDMDAGVELAEAWAESPTAPAGGSTRSAKSWSAQSQAWAESSVAPAGGSTKSSKTHSEEAAAARDLAQQYASDAAVVSGVNVPIYASVGTAEGSDIVAGVKTIRTQFYAPVYPAPGTLRGGAEYIRVSKSVIDGSGYPDLAYFRSEDTWMPDGTEDATNGGYWLINEHTCSPDMFGAALDGVSDDTAAANACALFCCQTGRNFRFGRGFMRLTDTLHFGLPVYDSLGWVKGIDGLYIDYSGATAAFNSDNRLYNANNLIAPTLLVDNGACVIADFTATNAAPKAVVSYNFRASGRSNGKVLFGAPLQIGRPINIAAGYFDTDANTGSVVPDNGLIGVWFPSIQRSIIGDIFPCNMGFSGVSSFICYQSQFSNIFSNWCGDACTIWEHNSGSVFATGNFCQRGAVYSGDSVKVSIGTQQCRTDVAPLTGDNHVIELRYIEDYSPSATDGDGAAVIAFGRSGGGTSQVRNATILSGRMGTVRPSKVSILGYGTVNLTCIGTRFYSKAPIFDSNSYGTFINTDLAINDLPKANFTVIDSGRMRSRSFHGLGGITYEGAFRVSATGLSISVPAGAGISASAVTRTITLPEGTIPASAGQFDYQNVIGQVDLAPGYNGVHARITGFNSATQVMTFQFWNWRSSSVTIDQAFHVYFKLTSTSSLTIDA